MNRIARWNGSACAPLGSGVTADVQTLAAFDDGAGAGLQPYWGGHFVMAGGSFHASAAEDSFVAKLQGCPAVSPCPADLDGDGAVGGADLGALLGAWGPGGGLGPADLDGSGAVDGADLGLFFADWGECP